MELEEITQQYVKEQLSQTHTLIPDASKNIHLFAEHWADHLKNDQSCYFTLNFFSDAVSILTDLKRGIDGATRQPIYGELVGLPEEEYSKIRDKLPRIAAVVYGKENLDNMEKFYKSE